MRLERRAGAADCLEGDQLVRHPGLDTAILLNGNPLGRGAEDRNSTFVNLGKSESLFVIVIFKEAQVVPKCISWLKKLHSMF